MNAFGFRKPKEILDYPEKDGEIFNLNDHVAMQKNPGETEKRQWLDIFSAIHTTWALSDEDSPLSLGDLITTEVPNFQKIVRGVKLVLKNAPTGSPVEVDILQEDSINSNTFTSVLTTKVVIPIGDHFITETILTLTGSTYFIWNTDRRLKFVLLNRDDGEDATGLKVTLH